jgi:hypothetical protein
MAAGVVEEIRRKLRDRESRRVEFHGCASTGLPQLDQLLPDGGWRRGAVVECLAGDLGDAAVTFAAATSRELLGKDGALFVMDGLAQCFPLALAGWGCPLDRVTVVRPNSPKESLWALEQILRCRGVDVVFCWQQDRIPPNAYRRLQLAAETGGATAFLFRPDSAAREPSWASLRLRVEPIPEPTAVRRLRVSEWNGGETKRSITLELDDGACAVRVVSGLAGAAPDRRAAWA